MNLTPSRSDLDCAPKIQKSSQFQMSIVQKTVKNPKKKLGRAKNLPQKKIKLQIISMEFVYLTHFNELPFK